MESDDDTKPPIDSGIPHRLLDLYDPGGSPPVILETWPEPGERLMSLVQRAAASDIPEEGVTVVAFALGGVDAISWAYDCCDTIDGVFSEDETALLSELQTWLDAPEESGRATLLKACLWQEDRTPAVLLGLAGGFQGAQLAPQWPVPVSADLTSTCVNEALMSALACVEPADREPTIGRFLRFAEQYL